MSSPSSPTKTAGDIGGSPTKAQAAIESLSKIIPSPLSLSNSPSAAFLLTSPDVNSQISGLLRQPTSGAGENPLCRWLYDTFQSSDPSLQLVVLRFIPLICGLYLTRVTRRQPLAGFEAVLLALYAHETTSRNGQAVSVTVPDLSNPSIYHESSSPQRNNSTDLNIAVISPSLEPHGTVRSTRRARIVGVAIELFYSKIWVMPIESKLDFCEFLHLWAGGDSGIDDDNLGAAPMAGGGGGGRIPIPWELMQPCLRVLGHCLLGCNDQKGKKKGELYEKSCKACRSLHSRAMHDLNPKAILAVGSLTRLIKIDKEGGDVDYTDIRQSNIISV